MCNLRWIVLFVTTLGLAGCASNANAPNGATLPPEALAILDKATEYELFSLDPNRLLEDEVDPLKGPEGKAAPKKQFHGWDILGRTTIKDAEVRKKVKDALLKGINDNEGAVADCFDPRHGLRVVHDKKILELVICFHCLQTEVYIDGKRGTTVLTTKSPQPTLDDVLKEAKVPLAK